MNSFFYTRENILMLTLSLPVIIGGFRYKILDMGAKIFYYQCVFSLVIEALAYYQAVYRHNNLVVYNISCVVELCIVSLYFNYTIEVFSKRRIGYKIAFFSLLVGIINIFYIQSIHGITHYYLTYQALITIVMCIFSLYSLLIRKNKYSTNNEVHFWIPIILMFNWSLCYLLFTLINYFVVRSQSVPLADSNSVLIALIFLSVVSYLTNLSIAAVFYHYKKLRAHG